MASILIYLGLRPKLFAVSDLRFPVVVIPPAQTNVFVARDAQSLTQVTMGAPSTPQQGTTVIDADFKIYAEENVKCDQGDFGMLYRALASPRKPLTFQMSLRQLSEHGIAAALDQIQKYAYFGTLPEEIDRQRKLLASQTTMQGIVDVLTPVFVGQAPP
jgi:hypothetical protein